ncbi:GNAT family N-acetyltransferase [Patulibacter defluvii]|uniref:GNAT family N-acetyltransferase n=1 Tax=Patulibacter defluvii TaxID=3095358 RepID=UPI002A75E822|nr:GNAT family N-acetyltransferase [Patulibacter sp. DM4]
MTELRRPALLDPAHHDRSDFDSGEPALDDWLRRYAGQNRRGNTAATWVIARPTGRVVAFASLAMTAIDRSSAPRPVATRAPDPVPALLLGRLAVDHRCSGQGIGTALVAHVLATAVELNAKAACRAVVVSALHEDVRSWWERLGFQPFDRQNLSEPELYLLTQDVHPTLDRLGASSGPPGVPSGP